MGVMSKLGNLAELSLVPSGLTCDYFKDLIYKMILKMNKLEAKLTFVVVT